MIAIDFSTTAVRHKRTKKREEEYPRLLTILPIAIISYRGEGKIEKKERKKEDDGGVDSSRK